MSVAGGVVSVDGGERTTSAQLQLRRLTGLRAIAAVLVLLFHTGASMPGPEGFEIVGSAGYVGVSFFFVLSGFILTWSLRPSTPRRTFYRRRIARIYPLHLATLVIAVTVITLEGGQLSLMALMANVTLTQAWVPVEWVYYGGNGVAWSISCEMFFYALLPFIAPRLLRASTRRCLIVAGAAAVTLMSLPIALHTIYSERDFTGLLWVFPPYRLAEFLLGVTAAVAFRRGFLRWRLAPAATVAALLYVIATAVHAYLETKQAPVPQEIASLVILPGVLLLIPAAAAADVSGSTGVLSGRVMVRLGEWSFALYLVHQLVIRVVELYIPRDELSAASGLAVQLGIVAVALGVAGACHVLLERPAERALRGENPSSVRQPSPRLDGME
jgi:peptidoglycan/LPS O-acetylase OafA/YrhL